MMFVMKQSSSSSNNITKYFYNKMNHWRKYKKQYSNGARKSSWHRMYGDTEEINDEEECKEDCENYVKTTEKDHCTVLTFIPVPYSRIPPTPSGSLSSLIHFECSLGPPLGSYGPPLLTSFQSKRVKSNFLAIPLLYFIMDQHLVL